VSAGLPASEFWDVTPREAGVILKGIVDRERRQLRIQQGLVYSLAELMKFAVNDPNKMPKFDKVFPDPDRKQKAKSDDEIWAAMSAWADAMRLAEGQSDGS
jgi:hypothetical protein